MFVEKQPVTLIDKKQLVPMVSDMKKNGYRLVIITCCLSESYDILYSFEKDMHFTSFRLVFPKAEPSIPSITGEYLAAFTYENELQDLFALKVENMALNFNGNFYKTSIKNPFTVPNPKLQQAAK
jgi:ech hydrogenase subunit D